MSVVTAPDVAGDMVRVHTVVSRGLDVSRQYLDRVASKPPDRESSDVHGAFFTYLEALAATLHMHHQLEDDLAFPYTRELIPELPFDRLAAEHQQIATALTELAPALDAGRAGDIEKAMPEIARILQHITAIWYPHIEQEQKYITRERLDEVLSPDEHAAFSERIVEHSRTHAIPDYLVVPFMLYSMPAGDRSLWAKKYPPIVTEQLIPKVWAEKWMPMKPFLLD